MFIFCFDFRDDLQNEETWPFLGGGVWVGGRGIEWLCVCGGGGV